MSSRNSSSCATKVLSCIYKRHNTLSLSFVLPYYYAVSFLVCFQGIPCQNGNAAAIITLHKCYFFNLLPQRTLNCATKAGLTLCEFPHSFETTFKSFFSSTVCLVEKKITQSYVLLHSLEFLLMFCPFKMVKQKIRNFL